MKAIVSAGFGGVENFENDFFLAFDSVADVRKMVHDHC